jgi:hypothetical protein
MNIDELTLKQIKEIQALLGTDKQTQVKPHPMIGKRCLIRTYSAGVHIGDIDYIEGMECKLVNALRLWSWSEGGLSLSAIANNGVVKGRINRTGEIYLTNVIEIIPTTRKAEETYIKYIEDDK